MKSTYEFIECESCRAKPGSPELCQSCFQNRTAIAHWKGEVHASRVAFIVDLYEIRATYMQQEATSMPYAVSPNNITQALGYASLSSLIAIFSHKHDVRVQEVNEEIHRRSKNK